MQSWFSISFNIYMIKCKYVFNSKAKLWQCFACNEPLPENSPCHRQFCRLPPNRECKAKLTPEQLAQREAARAEQEEAAKRGPGTYLHKLIKKLTGEDITPSCLCKDRIAKMNRNGPAWCRDNVDTIVGWMEEEIERRLKEDKPGWRLKLAGYNLPGQRLAIKRIVLLACTLAERAEKCTLQSPS